MMTEILIVAGLMVLSMVFNSMISRWSARRFIGIELSFMKANFLVLSRSLAALLAGFCVGYAIKLGFNSGEEMRGVKIVGVLLMSLVSFFIYWGLMQKVSGKKIELLTMIKSVAAEAGVLIVSIVAISIVLSTIFVLLKIF